MEENTQIEENEQFNDIVKDITEFVECTKRCILPHNILLYNIIMNSLEMMIIRSEQEGEEDTFSKVIVIGNNQCECNQNDSFNFNNVSEETKKEIDSIIDDISKELGE